MVLKATWQSSVTIEPRSWRFQTIHGLGGASVSAGGAGGQLLVTHEFNTRDAFVDAGRFSDLGVSAFFALPTIDGQRAAVRMTAIPRIWLEAPESVATMFRRIGLLAQVSGQSIEIRSERMPLARMLRQAGLLCLALDPFTKKRTSPSDLEKTRRSAISEEDWLLDLLHHDAGERAIRAALGIRIPQRHTPALPERRLNSSESPPMVPTSTGAHVSFDLGRWEKAGRVLSTRTVDPRWLIYLPAEMCSIQTDSLTEPLEHPKAAFDYYRAEGIKKLVVELKHMGSRAIVIICRDQSVARRRFGTMDLGAIFTRNGRPFFERSDSPIRLLHTALSKAKVWERFNTDWICLDGEFLPWSLKAEKLIDDTHLGLLSTWEGVQGELRSAEALISPEDSDLLTRRAASFSRYRNLISYYEEQTGSDPRFAPFQVIATEGQCHLGRSHLWQMESLHALSKATGGLLEPTPFQLVALDNTEDVQRCFRWWEELCARAEEGVVVKPIHGIPRGRRGQAQPAIKCRTPEHLRLVYGPDYDIIENRWALSERDSLKRRREKHRRVLRQFALVQTAVQSFVDGAPAETVENCIRGVLCLSPTPPVGQGPSN